ncbi:MAG: hypothetical protein R2827_16350 [Bdellovibrionales bacterium]
MKLLQLKVLPMIQLPNKLLSLLFIFKLFCYPFVGYADTRAHNQVYVQGGTFSFDVLNTANDTSDSLSGFGAYTIGGGITIFENYLIFGGYSLILSQGLSGSTATGFDFGVRYYHWTRPTKVTNTTPLMVSSFFNLYNPYVGFALRSRDFLDTLTSTYLGPGVIVGVDYRYQEDYFLNGEFRYETLQSPASKQATQMNLMIGFGLYF